MGSIPRFPWQFKQLAGSRTKRLNTVYARIVQETPDIIMIKIAEKTGDAFKKDPTLFAQDKFHPNARGYVYWTTLINQALDQNI